MTSPLLAGLPIFRLTIKHIGLVLFLLLSGSDPAAGQPNSRNDPYGATGSISPTMGIVVMVVISSLFFIGFFTVYIRICRGTADDATGGARGMANSAAARGLDASVIETFPTFVYSEVKMQKIGKGALECAICLNEFGDDETLRLLPKCDHVFHPHCIGAWLAGHLTCPVCRTNLAEEQQIAEPVEPEVITITETDLEAQQLAVPEPEVEDVTRVKLSRSHTTGHSVVLPGQNTNRFTLKLPEDLRKKIMENWKLNRSKSLLVLPIESSKARLDQWLFRKTPSFLWRNRDDGSIKLGGTGSIKGNALQSPTGDSVRADRWAFLRNPSFLWRNKDGEGTSSVQNNGTAGLASGSVKNLPV